MYRSFFGLERQPFELTADPALLFLTSQHREALAGLTYVVLERKGFAVLASDAGMGKTTVLEALLRQLPADRVQIGAILNPVLSPAEFFEMALMRFGPEPVPASKAQRVRLFQQMLLRNHSADRTSMLLVDEAQKLSPDVLDEIRLLSNFEKGEQKLLQIVLAGQRELEQILDRPELWQLKQRISLWLSIRPLTFVEVQEYIRHRWISAGGKDTIPFQAEALKAINGMSGGIPRLINSICDTSLLLAFADSECEVTLNYVIEACRDLRLHIGANAKALPFASPPEGTTTAPESASPLTEPVRRRPGPAFESRPELAGTHRALNRRNASGGSESLLARFVRRLTTRHSVRTLYDPSLTPSTDHGET